MKNELKKILKELDDKSGIKIKKSKFEKELMYELFDDKENSVVMITPSDKTAIWGAGYDETAELLPSLKPLMEYLKNENYTTNLIDR